MNTPTTDRQKHFDFGVRRLKRASASRFYASFTRSTTLNHRIKEKSVFDGRGGKKEEEAGSSEKLGSRNGAPFHGSRAEREAFRRRAVEEGATPHPRIVYIPGIPYSPTFRTKPYSYTVEHAGCIQKTCPRPMTRYSSGVPLLTTSLTALTQASFERHDVVVDDRLRDLFPDALGDVHEVFVVLDTEAVLGDLLLQVFPEVFDGIQVGRAWWPVVDVLELLVDEVVFVRTDVASCTVVLVQQVAVEAGLDGA